MRVFQIEDDWGFDNLVLSNRPEPKPERGQVVVAMRMAALNARDLIVPERGYGRATGEVVAIRPDVSRVGGVALFALAFVKMHGAHVTVMSSSGERLENVRAMGADETINYRETKDWARASRPITADRGGFGNIIELGGAHPCRCCCARCARGARCR